MVDSWHLESTIPDTQNDIWVLSVEDGTAQPFRNTGLQERDPAFSPDGKWISYLQGADQDWQLWVAPYPGPGIPHQISTDGGSWSIWSADGRKLFFRGRGETVQQVFAAAIQTEPAFSRSDPESLFELDFLFWVTDLHPDGERFAIVRRAATGVAQINVVLNWFEDLNRLVPTDNDQ